jgi:hypothetical protein
MAIRLQVLRRMHSNPKGASTRPARHSGRDGLRGHERDTYDALHSGAGTERHQGAGSLPEATGVAQRCSFAAAGVDQWH